MSAHLLTRHVEVYADASRRSLQHAVDFYVTRQQMSTHFLTISLRIGGFFLRDASEICYVVSRRGTQAAKTQPAQAGMRETHLHRPLRYATYALLRVTGKCTRFLLRDVSEICYVVSRRGTQPAKMSDASEIYYVVSQHGLIAS